MVISHIKRAMKMNDLCLVKSNESEAILGQGGEGD